MPKIQLIRKDGQIIELNATQIGISVTRGVAAWPIPIIATRAALDLNANMMSINIDGIITDDTQSSGSNGASCVLDLSRPVGTHASWFDQQIAQGNNSITLVKNAIHGQEIVFSTKGQIAAGLGEKIILRFDKGSNFSSTVATSSVVRVNLSGTVTQVSHIATAIKTALDAAQCKVGTTTTNISTILTTTLSVGAKQANSATAQGLSNAAAAGNEKVQITNIATGQAGNTPVIARGSTYSSTLDWPHSFFISPFTGGVDGSRKSKGDKVQDLLNMTMNASVGGAMISPQALTGGLIELPDSLSSLDVSKLLGISESDSVKKYIVGLRIPYESMVTAGSDSSVLRQFIIPSGPGTDYAAEKNTEPFDPTVTEGGITSRPNPFFVQKVAIPGVVQTFTPSFSAGDSVWTFSLGFAAVEQLIGI